MYSLELGLLTFLYIHKISTAPADCQQVILEYFVLKWSPSSIFLGCGALVNITSPWYGSRARPKMINTSSILHGYFEPMSLDWPLTSAAVQCLRWQALADNLALNCNLILIDITFLDYFWPFAQTAPA